MKIYFAGSISAGRQDVPIYQKIISLLKNYGEVLTEFIGNDNLTGLGEEKLSDQFIHDRDLEWLLSCDLVVAEVTTPSLGVGYEIGRAIENHIKILCLYRKIDGKRLSAMINGAPKLTVFEYRDVEDIEAILKSSLTNF
jgi:hypothetical protein